VDSTTFTGSYTLTQTDVDAGTFGNTATVTGTPPSGPDVTGTDTDTQTLAQSATITLAKTGTLNDDDGTAGVSAGDTISYAFTVTNTGNVTLTNVTLADTVGGVTISGGPIASLAPAAVDSTTFTGSYTLTQTDVDAGTFGNTATVTGTPPSGPDVTGTDTDTQTLTTTPAVEVVKTGALNDGGNGATVGDLIDYTFDVTNTGGVTLTNVSVTDPLIASISCPGGNPVPSLAPTASVQCTGSYAITQADIDAGSRANTATATGDCPQSQACATDTDTHTETLTPTPGVEVVKNGSLDDGGDGLTVGDVIDYTFDVTNTGNVTLTNVSVTDPLITTISCPGGNPIPSLAPAASVQCTGSYTITQADIDAGSRVNTATVTGDCPQSQACATDTDTNTVPLTPTPAVEIVKTGALDDGGDGPTVGDLINYTFQVTNTGAVTLTNVSITDPLIASISCPSGNPIPSLAVGASQTCTGSYAITQADIDAGSRANTATATGDCPQAPACATDTDTHTETIRPQPIPPSTPAVPVPANDRLALVLMALLLLAAGWYYRPAGRRRS